MVTAVTCTQKGSKLLCHYWNDGIYYIKTFDAIDHWGVYLQNSIYTVTNHDAQREV